MYVERIIKAQPMPISFSTPASLKGLIQSPIKQPPIHSLSLHLFSMLKEANITYKMATMDIIIFTTFILFTISISSACNKQDKAALLSFKKSFPSANFPSWTPHTDCCSWTDVECDDLSGRVNVLSLDEKPALNGTLPSSIGDLIGLQDLSLGNFPNLKGPFPPKFKNLKNLQHLTIYKTSLSGSIPKYFSTFTQLKQLSLMASRFTGPIPSSLGKLSELFIINFWGNQLAGNIPGSLFSRYKGSDLVDFDLSLNKLTGKIPRSFGNVSFASVNLMSNKLTGDASFLFGRSKPAIQIILASNRLAFDLSKVEYPEKNLVFVDISHNEIYGRISEQIVRSTKLGHFDVSYNRLCGKIPAKMGNAMDASFFEHNKCLCGKPLPACK